MEKLPMCRICLVENVRMFVVGNRNLHELYEKLTDIPFVTEDRRPMLACFFCCAKLKQCYRLLRQCVEAEELFPQMMNTPKHSINQHHLEFFSGFIKSPTEIISIVDGGQTESIAVKVELPAVCERLDDIIEPKEEHQSDEVEPEHLDNSCLDVADIPPHHSGSDLEDDVSLIEFKTEVEEEVSMKKQRASETKWATVAKKLKLDTRRTKQKDAMIAEQTKNDNSDSGQPARNRLSGFRTTRKGDAYECDVCHRSFSKKKNFTRHIRIHTGEKPFTCDVCQRCFSENNTLLKHIRIHTGEKPYKCDVCQRSFTGMDTLTKHKRIHTGEKPYKCDVCQRCFSIRDSLVRHIRIHTGEKPYKCDVCQRSFTEMNNLTKHIRIHTGEKPYKCNECQRKFTQNTDLTKHKRVHTGEKPYKCDVCRCSFIKKGNLTKHNCGIWNTGAGKI